MLMDPHPRKQHAGLHHSVWKLEQEVTRPKARFKPTFAKKSGVDGGANQVLTYLGQSLHLYSHGDIVRLLSPLIIALVGSALWCSILSSNTKALVPMQQWQEPDFPVEKPLQRNRLSTTLRHPKESPHSTTYLKVQTTFLLCSPDYVFWSWVLIHFSIF